MTDISTTALNTRAQALNTNPVVITEVRDIELAIQAAGVAGLLATTVSTTHMTLPTSTGSPGPAEAYFNVWQNLATDRVAQLQMTTVMAYFTNNGYSMTRTLNTATNNTFKWTIQW